MANRTNLKTFKLTYLAIMTAFVIILQLLGSFIRFGTFAISPVLVPIVVGIIVGGTSAGAWLGLVFGATVLLSGDAALFLGIDPIGTVVTVLAKGILCGLAAGFVYELFAKKNKYIAISLAALTCPIVNTGVFFLGTRLFFWDFVESLAIAESVSAVKYVIFFFIGGNFIFEILLNVLLCPIIFRLLNKRIIPTLEN